MMCVKKRWLGLYVENEIGVLARIAGLFSGKSYNLDSLTVGVTEDETISRMTISVFSDDKTFEQIKRQLDRCVEVIEVMDYTGLSIHLKEILFAKIEDCSEQERTKALRLAASFQTQVREAGAGKLLLECVQTESENDRLVFLLKSAFPGRIRLVRGGGVAIESEAGTHSQAVNEAEGRI